jgi:hypothetical protein
LLCQTSKKLFLFFLTPQSDDSIWCGVALRVHRGYYVCVVCVQVYVDAVYSFGPYDTGAKRGRANENHPQNVERGKMMKLRECMKALLKGGEKRSTHTCVFFFSFCFTYLL